MVDLNTCPPTPPAAERSKIKSFMGRTPGIGMLKSKFLTVLGNSNELLNGISNKLTLSISSSDSEYCDDDEEEVPKFDETIDYTKIDYEFRRVKARRAHEELISGRFRYPNLAPSEGPRLDAMRVEKTHRSLSSSSSSSDSSSSLHSPPVSRSHVSSTTRSNSIESRHSGGYGRPGRAIAGARRSDLDIQKDMMRINELLNSNTGPPHIDVQPPSDREHSHSNHNAHYNVDFNPGTAANMAVPPRSRTSNSSTVTSLRDDPDALMSPSVESTDWKNFIRSESQNSVPSWASSISLDCRAGEEPVKEFMKRFTDVLFTNAAAISLELKAEFGALARLEIGRQWFTRFLLEQKTKSKRVDELTFHSLVQYFAIVLFECGECEDYGPASILMNLCFLFYNEIEVPGCDAYREYLFTFMRQQPVWHTLRFWNAAFFDAVQSEREHRLMLKKRHEEKREKRKQAQAALKQEKLNASNEAQTADDVGSGAAEAASSSSSSHHSEAIEQSQQSVKRSGESTQGGANAEGANNGENGVDREYEQHMVENIVFRQLGAFTCNMHALGIPQDMCLEFLKKQSANVSFNLSKEKTKLIKDNVGRMYHETDLWGAKES